MECLEILVHHKFSSKTLAISGNLKRRKLVEIKEHPETKEGEIFLGNFIEIHFQHLPWKAKRMGKVAYDADDNEFTLAGALHSPNEVFRPVFIKIREFEDRLKAIFLTKEED
jgi:hypothetical protein